MPTQTVNGREPPVGIERAAEEQQKAFTACDVKATLKQHVLCMMHAVLRSTDKRPAGRMGKLRRNICAQ